MSGSKLARLAPHLTVALVLVAFVVINARGLDSAPPINEDEAWIAAPGVEFFNTGHFATRLFAGYFGSERHYYDFMPLYSLLDGGVIKIFGRSLIAVRSLSLALAALTLLLTFLLGRRLLSEWHGAMAVLILGFWPIAATGVRPYLSLSTGIPLTDLGRIGRYDVLVPVLGLLSMLALLRALDAGRQRIGLLALAGAISGLAALAHYYGALWFVVIVAMVIATDGRRGVSLLVWPAAGFAAAMAPWVWFISRDFPAFTAQKQAQAERYGLTLSDVPGELSRYALIAKGATSGHIASLLWIGAVLVGIVLLARSGWRHKQGGHRLLAIAVVVMTACFALLVWRRLFNYLGTIWPLFALTASFALLHPWPARLRTFARAAAALLVITATSEGAVAYRELSDRAKSSSTYSGVCDRIAQNIPPDARLLALQFWWLGVGDRVADYRSFIVPLTRMDPRATAEPVSFEEAMALDPMDYILIDPEMADVLRAAGDPSRPKASPVALEVGAFLKARTVEVDRFADPTYGTFRLYRVNPLLVSARHF